MTELTGSFKLGLSAARVLLHLGVAIVSAIAILACAGIATSLWLRPIVLDGEGLAIASSLVVFAGTAFLGLKLNPATVAAAGLIQAAFVTFSYAAGLAGMDAPVSELSTVLGASGLSMLSVGTAAVLLTIGFTRVAQARSASRTPERE